MPSSPTRPLDVFDVSVLRGDGHVWLSAHTAQGSVFGVPRPLPVWDAATPDLGAWLNDAVGRARDARAGGLAVGRVLSELLFGAPDVAALLQQARGAVAAVGGQLLVRILAAPHDVSAWPWEFLVDPQRPADFLTLARDVHVVRSGRTRTYAVRRDPVVPPLNLLLVMSSPVPDGRSDSETPFDLYAEKRSLLAELAPLVECGLLTVDVEDRPTVENLRSRIGARPRGYHLFHYLGHARPDGLKLEQPNGRSKMISSADLARLLQQMPDLRLAVFAGCATARAPEQFDTLSDWPGPMSTADYCVRDASPLVIGMQAVLPFDTERLFTRFFYQALTGGQSVAEALRLARLAIDGDEFSGGNLVNWAVPCLYGGGSLPDPITDPSHDAKLAPRSRRVGLRLGVRQGELKFISRLSELREAVDVLTGRRTTRLLHVIGLRGTGKTALLDRAVEELDAGVVVLFLSAQNLLTEADPVGELCRLVAELLKRAGERASPAGRLASVDWWQRLLEDLIDVRFALVVDDGEELTAATPDAGALLDALVAMTRRRGRARLGVAALEEIPALTQSLQGAELSKVTLRPLSWPEVWNWIRRNLPVLTRYDEWTLAPFFHDLPHLEQWSELGALLAARDDATLASPELAGIVAALATRSTVPVPATAPPKLGAEPAAMAVPAGWRALRVAVAGPDTAGREAEFGRAVTSFAAQWWVSGRIVGGESPDATSGLAELLSIPTPFVNGVATTERLTSWLHDAANAGADVVVLDFGGPAAESVARPLLDELVADGRLLIAAGGNSNEPTYPAFFPDVLAAGALTTADIEEPAPYSKYFAEPAKPDLYAPERLRGPGIKVLLADADAVGTSMAAIYVAAVAIVVWASDRDLYADDVRRLLLDSAAPLHLEGGATARRLDVEEALRRTRKQLVLDTLEWDALELRQLLSETGLRPEILVPLLDSMVPSELTRTSTGGTERFENPRALYLQYAQLRQRPSGRERTQRLQRLVDSAKELARRGRYTAAKVQALWSSGHDGRRIVALAVMQAKPEFAAPALVADALRASRSAFEQYQALLLARSLLPTLSEPDRERIKDAVRVNPPTSKGGDTSRTALATAILRAR